VAREIRSNQEDNLPEVSQDSDLDQDVDKNIRGLLEKWDRWLTELYQNEVRVYTDG